MGHAVPSLQPVAHVLLHTRHCQPMHAIQTPLQVCSALAQVAKHSVDLAEVVVEAEVFPKVLTCLKVSGCIGFRGFKLLHT